MSNLRPERDRAVSVAHVDALTPDALRDHLLGREAYRRTRYIVARSGAACALVEVARAAPEPLFSPIVGVEVLAGPHECELVDAPDVDTSVPTQMARAAATLAPQARCVVVHGRYEHVGFILDPRPLRIRVVDVVPPEPAKLLDQASRVLATAEDLPPIELVPELVDLRELVAATGADQTLLPCRGSGVATETGRVHYLDERPPRADWTLVGCTRSQQLHEWFYGSLPTTVDVCPARRVVDGQLPVLTKCCLLEQGASADEGRITVGWGATLDDVRSALARLAAAGEPSWARA